MFIRELLRKYGSKTLENICQRKLWKQKAQKEKKLAFYTKYELYQYHKGTHQ